MDSTEIMDLLLDTPEYAKCLEDNDFIELYHILQDAEWSDVITVLVNDADIDVLSTCKHNGQLLNVIPFCFFEGSDITTINIPNNIKTIDNRAFEDCQHLTSVTIPDSVETIGDRAFAQCSSLKSLKLGNGLDVSKYRTLNSLGNNVFLRCTSLETLTLPESVSYIPYKAFYGCENLKEVIVTSNTLHVDAEAFSKCSDDLKIIIPWKPEYEQNPPKIQGAGTSQCEWLYSHIIIRGRNKKIQDSLNRKEKACKLIEDLYTSKNTASGKYIFDKFKNEGYLKKLKSIAHSLSEDYTEGENDWGDPETIEKTTNHLAQLTDNFTEDPVSIKADETESRIIAEKILKVYYRNVEIEEGRNSDMDSNIWYINCSNLITSDFDMSELDKQIDNLRNTVDELQKQVNKADNIQKTKVVEALDTADIMNFDSIVNLAVSVIEMQNLDAETALNLSLKEHSLDVDNDSYFDLLQRVESQVAVHNNEI